MVTGNERDIPVAPEFLVADLDLSLGFYRERLGFRLTRREADFAVVALGDAHVLLAVPNDPKMRTWLASGRRGAGVNVRIMVDDVDSMYERASAGDGPVVFKLQDQAYGLRDFMVADPDGYLLRFATPIES